MIRAAKYLGVAPWQLIGTTPYDHTRYWVEWAMVCETAEVKAERLAIKSARQAARVRGN